VKSDDKIAEAEVVEEKPTVETETAVVPAGGNSVDFADDDNVGMDEIILPRLNIVQKVGPLSEEYVSGEVVLNKELVIYEPAKKDKKAESLQITVLGFRPTQWTERIAGGALGRLCKTEADVVACGGTTDYKRWEASAKAAKEDRGEEIPYFQPLATCLVLIQKPEGLEETYFPYDFGGEQYAIAQWSMKGGAFTNGAKVIKTARKIGHLRRGGYVSYEYLLDTKFKAYGEGHGAIIPVLRPGRKHTAEFVEFAREILGGGGEDESGSI
jgi:hypothetical protein